MTQYLPELAAGVILVALIAYALFGGADFGGGVWDLFAFGPRAEEQRRTITRAIGPIWEANHVWLIVAIVVLFTAFPRAFAVTMTALFIPVTLMLIGIVLRGSSFVFRNYDSRETRVQQRWGRIFSMSSIITPVLLGVVIGTISTRAITVEDGVVTSGFFSWLRPFPLAVGVFALVQFAYLAATYLTVEAEDEAVREDFRARALVAAGALGVVAGTVLLLWWRTAPELGAELVGREWSRTLQVATGAMAVGAIAMLWRRRYLLARLFAAGQVALILLGWGLAMSPYLVAGELTIRGTAAPARTLRLLLVVLAAGSLILLPALIYLFRTFKGGVIFAPLHRPQGGSAPAPAPAPPLTD